MNARVITVYVSFMAVICAPVALLILMHFIVAAIAVKMGLNLWKIVSGAVVNIAKEMPEDMRKIKFSELIIGY